MSNSPTENPPTLNIFESDLRPMQYWHTVAEDKLTAWMAGQPEGYTTGFPTIDQYFRLVAGELVTIAGRPSQGKTILGVQMAQGVAKTLTGNDCVAIFSAEMTGWSLYHRMAGAMAGVNVHALRMGKPERPDDGQRLIDAMATLRTLPMWIDDGSAPTTDSMMRQLARLNETNPVRLMVFDFMELGGDRAATEEQRVSSIAIALKDIAKALGIPVIALSQLNRGVESRANKMPSLADLRYSGQIEQVSDVVAMIMRPEYYIERGMTVDCPAQDRSGVAYLSIAKNRHGPVANVRLAFVKERSMFAELQKVYVNGGQP